MSHFVEKENSSFLYQFTANIFAAVKRPLLALRDSLTFVLFFSNKQLF